MPQPEREEKQREWKILIEQQRQSGLSIEKWCLQSKIHPHVFHYWKSKLFPKQLEKSSFTELHSTRLDAMILQVKGLHIRISADCNPRLRKALFSFRRFTPIS